LQPTKPLVFVLKWKFLSKKIKYLDKKLFFLAEKFKNLGEILL